MSLILKNSVSGKLNNDSSESTMFGKINSTQNNNLKTSEDLLKILYTNVGSSLNNLIQNYSLGNLMEVSKELTVEKYNNLSVTFRNNSRPDNLYYEVIRLLFSKTLDGLMRSITQYIDLLNITSKLEECNKYKNILDDPTKLKEYIEKLAQQSYLFDVEPITMIKATVKQEYVEYIKLYGFPEGGIFDSVKLGNVIYKLENNIPLI